MVNALDRLKSMLELDRKTLRIEDIAPLVKQIEKDYIRMGKKLSKVNDIQVKLDIANRHVLSLSNQLRNVHTNHDIEIKGLKMQISNYEFDKRRD